MKSKITIVPFVIATGFVAFVVLHPGQTYAKPRMASGMPTPFAEKASYTIDQAHASISFEITHLGLSKTHGRINKFSGKIYENEKDLTKSSVEFTAEAASIDTAVAARDEHLRAADFFDVAKYPTLTFKSKKVTKSKDGYVVSGDLTMKGKTKEIAIPFKHYGPLTVTLGDKSTRIGVIADPITIKRSDFGIGGDFRLPDGTEGASDVVTIRISLEATLDK